MSIEKKSIFIVDDMEENLLILNEILEQEGAKLSFAKSGQEALNLIPKVKPDIILLDIFMPGLDGYEVCKKLKKDPRTIDIPVIFLTGGANIENLINGFDVGAVDYITKPFDPEELIVRINTHIELKKARDIIRMQNKELKKVNNELDLTNLELIKSSVQLMQSEEKFKKLFEQSKDGIIIHSPTGKILDINAEACQMLKYDKKELIEKPLLSVFNKNTMKSAVKSFIKIRELGTYRFETKLKRADGEIIDVESSSKVIDKKKGIVQSIFRDITQSKLIKADLKKREKYFRHIYNNTPYSILTIKSNGTIIDANSVTLHLFDINGFYSIKDTNIKDFFLFKNNSFVDDYHNFIKKGEKTHKEYCFKPNNGKVLWFNIHFIPIKNFDGVIINSYVLLENITERKIAEQEIHKLSTAVEQSPVSIIITNTDNNIEYANPMFTKLTGYSFKEVKGKNPKILHSGKTPKETFKKLWKTITSGKTWQGEFINKKKNGNEFIEKCLIAPIKDSNNRITNYIALKEDITEQKNTLKALENSEDKFKKLSNLTFEGILIHDKGVAVEINHSFANISGYDYEELIGKNMIELLIPQEYHALIQQKINEKYEKPYEYEVIKKDGTRIPVEAESRNVIYKGKKLRVTALRDITERKEALLALEKSEKEQRMILNSYVDGVYTCSPDYKITYMNPAMKEIIGHDATGKTCHKSIYNSDKPCEKCVFNKLRTDRKIAYDYHDEIRNNDYHIKNILFGDGSKLSIYYDITERKKAEILLQLQKKELEDNNKSVISSISYASVIQNAVLPNRYFLKQFLPESFVLFLPRDIVSGDFYWIKQVHNHILVAVADCTGHGVPGAFMSMLGIAYLNEAVSSLKNRNNLKANTILNKLRKKLKLALHQDRRKNTASDGMDMALCIINIEEMKMQYAGANNPIYIIRNNKESGKPELTHYKPDNMPIGVHLKEKPFTNNKIQLQADDTIYLFSDGFVDQFGGTDDRKYRSGRFKEFLLSICHKSLSDQKKILHKEFNSWKGDKNQVDDVLIMGLKIHESYGDVDLF
ncbi:MAG: PAS domain S-box protein [Bacteroidales bacterium]|nr:PAS domain S-box protein [Bacteroidales bacterium]